MKPIKSFIWWCKYRYYSLEMFKPSASTYVMKSVCDKSKWMGIEPNLRRLCELQTSDRPECWFICGLPEISATKKQNDIPMVNINRWERVSEKVIAAILEFNRSCCCGGEIEARQGREALKEMCQGASAWYLPSTTSVFKKFLCETAIVVRFNVLFRVWLCETLI